MKLGGLSEAEQGLLLEASSNLREVVTVVDDEDAAGEYVVGEAAEEALATIVRVLSRECFTADERPRADDAANEALDDARARPVSHAVAGMRVIEEHVLPILAIAAREKRTLALAALKVIAIVTLPVASGAPQATLALVHRLATAIINSHAVLSMVKLAIESVARTGKARRRADNVLVELVLTVLRNLLAAPTVDVERLDYGRIGSAADVKNTLLVTLHRDGALDMVLHLAANVSEPENQRFNLLLLEICSGMCTPEYADVVSASGPSAPRPAAQASATGRAAAAVDASLRSAAAAATAAALAASQSLQRDVASEPVDDQGVEGDGVRAPPPPPPQQQQQPAVTARASSLLGRLVRETEQRQRRTALAEPARHSRFGGTIRVTRRPMQVPAAPVAATAAATGSAPGMAVAGSSMATPFDDLDDELVIEGEPPAPAMMASQVQRTAAANGAGATANGAGASAAAEPARPHTIIVTQARAIAQANQAPKLASTEHVATVMPVRLRRAAKLEKASRELEHLSTYVNPRALSPASLSILREFYQSMMERGALQPLLENVYFHLEQRDPFSVVDDTIRWMRMQACLLRFFRRQCAARRPLLAAPTEPAASSGTQHYGSVESLGMVGTLIKPDHLRAGLQCIRSAATDDARPNMHVLHQTIAYLSELLHLIEHVCECADRAVASGVDDVPTAERPLSWPVLAEDLVRRIFLDLDVMFTLRAVASCVEPRRTSLPLAAELISALHAACRIVQLRRSVTVQHHGRRASKKASRARKGAAGAGNVLPVDGGGEGEGDLDEEQADLVEVGELAVADVLRDVMSGDVVTLMYAVLCARTQVGAERVAECVGVAELVRSQLHAEAFFFHWRFLVLLYEIMNDLAEPDDSALCVFATDVARSFVTRLSMTPQLIAEVMCVPRTVRVAVFVTNGYSRRDATPDAEPRAPGDGEAPAEAEGTEAAAGAKGSRKQWSAEDDRFLRETYGKFRDLDSAPEILALSLPGRTAENVRRRLISLGLIESKRAAAARRKRAAASRTGDAATGGRRHRRVTDDSSDDSSTPSIASTTTEEEVSDGNETSSGSDAGGAGSDADVGASPVAASKHAGAARRRAKRRHAAAEDAPSNSAPAAPEEAEHSSAVELGGGAHPEDETAPPPAAESAAASVGGEARKRGKDGADESRRRRVRSALLAAATTTSRPAASSRAASPEAGAGVVDHRSAEEAEGAGRIRRSSSSRSSSSSGKRGESRSSSPVAAFDRATFDLHAAVASIVDNNLGGGLQFVLGELDRALASGSAHTIVPLQRVQWDALDDPDVQNVLRFSGASEPTAGEAYWTLDVSEQGDSVRGARAQIERVLAVVRSREVAAAHDDDASASTTGGGDVSAIADATRKRRLSSSSS